MEPTLGPCPFCASGSTSFRDNQFWTGRSFQLISAEVHHWCVRQEGAPQSHIVIGGRDRQHAAALWNAAALTPSPSMAEQIERALAWAYERGYSDRAAALPRYQREAAIAQYLADTAPTVNLGETA